MVQPNHRVMTATTILLGMAVAIKEEKVSPSPQLPMKLKCKSVDFIWFLLILLIYFVATAAGYRYDSAIRQVCNIRLLLRLSLLFLFLFLSLWFLFNFNFLLCLLPVLFYLVFFSKLLVVFLVVCIQFVTVWLFFII